MPRGMISLGIGAVTMRKEGLVASAVRACPGIGPIRRLLSSHELLSQAFATFLRMWLAHTPRIPAELRRQAQASADARYRLFMQRLSEQVSGGKRFIDDLPQEPIADNEELEAIARRASDEIAAAARRPPPDGSDEAGGSKPTQ
jgi:hypothetical protein